VPEAEGAGKRDHLIEVEVTEVRRIRKLQSSSRSRLS